MAAEEETFASGWETVEANPLDFEAWERLLASIEAKQSQGQDCKAALFKAYDAFLSRFPLTFGYWKKYSSLLYIYRFADWKVSLAGNQEAKLIYQRALAAIRNSVALWCHYCHFTMQTAETDDYSRRFV